MCYAIRGPGGIAGKLLHTTCAESEIAFKYFFSNRHGSRMTEVVGWANECSNVALLGTLFEVILFGFS